MKKFYEILFKKSKPIKEDNFNGLTVNIDDIINGFVEEGYNKYQDCCGIIHFQKEEFTKAQLEEIEKEGKMILNHFTDEISQEINKKIIEDMKQKGLIPSFC